MGAHRNPATGRSTRRTALALAFAVTGLAVTGTGVYAALNAQATAIQSIASGTLSLTMANNGAGFSTSISGLAPGDVVNRYVNLTNGGTLPALGLTLKAADSSASPLDNSFNTGTAGLEVTVTQCNGGVWSPTTGLCGGTTSVLLASTPMATVISTAQTLLGATTAVAVGAVTNIQVSVALAGTETTTNGTPPANTIQGDTANITWTFDEQQRAAATTNS
ncbi:MAG TPA: TasA family protein [Mycobacteriales bacterium]|nr:TasA family protein [Mycobacteriales bacterium]